MRTDDYTDFSTAKLREYTRKNKRLCILLVFTVILVICFMSLFFHQLSKQHQCSKKLTECNSTVANVLASNKENNGKYICLNTSKTPATTINESSYVIQGALNSASRLAPRICPAARWNGTGVTVVSKESSVLIDVFIDGKNAMYIADSYNHRILKWDEGATEGRIVAGGNGKGNRSDQFDVITSVFLDHEESIYAADQHNHRIQKWEKNSKIGKTIIGQHGRGKGLHQIDNCWGLYVDKELNIYVSEHSNHRVTKWKAGANVGQIVADVIKPIGIYVDESNDNLYVASYAYHAILQFDKTGKRLRKVGTKFLKSPYDFALVPGTLSIDPSVIIADSENHRIVKMQMNEDDTMEIITDKKENEFNEPRRVRFDSKGNLIVADSNNGRIQKFFIYNNIC